MKVVVLGPNGQLGSDILAANARNGGGIDIEGVGRDALDVTDLDGIEGVLGPMSFDALVNCTSYHKTDEVEKNASLAFTINAHAVQRMATVCASKGARFVHISTDYVFSGDATKPYVEEDRPGPLNVYGASKLMGEGLARNVHDDTLVLRVASLFGVAGASGKGGNFVETMIRVGKEKGELRVVDDITMSPAGTEDVAEALLVMLTREAPAGIYHVVNSEPATWYEFAVAILNGAQVSAKVTPVTSEEYPTVASRPPYSVLDNAKVAAAVGGMATWREALERYLRAKGHAA
jgi:dTDP-4-dehydrorhamnose reductase